jgi:hypothetical protein
MKFMPIVETKVDIFCILTLSNKMLSCMINFRLNIKKTSLKKWQKITTLYIYNVQMFLQKPENNVRFKFGISDATDVVYN